MFAPILTLAILIGTLSAPHPADVALLQNARAPVSGASGFATLAATLEATASLPREIPRMERDEAAPLAFAREHLPLWQALPAVERAALLPDLPPLLRFAHFRRAASIRPLSKPCKGIRFLEFVSLPPPRPSPTGEGAVLRQIQITAAISHMDGYETVAIFAANEFPPPVEEG